MDTGRTCIGSIFKSKKCAARNQIQILNQQQSVTGGYTSQKNLKREELAEKTDSIALRLRGYAKLHKDEVMKKIVSPSKATVLKYPDVKFLNHCQTVYEQAKQNESKLAGYNVDAGQVDELMTIINDYSPMISIRNEVKGKRSSSTARVIQLLNEAKEYMDNLDDMVYGVIKDADFLDAYRQARKVIDPYTRRTKEVTEKPKDEKSEE